MPNQKVIFYNTAKNLALRLNINPPNYRTATVQSLRNFIANINRPTLPFLAEVRTSQRRNITYISHERGIGMREYFINDFNHETNEISNIMHAISERLNHALRDGITLNADVNITFSLFNDGYNTTKKFNSFLIKDLDDFRRMLRNYVDMTASQHINYTFHIDRLKIQIIRENAGGCYKGGQDKITVIGDVKLISTRATNNDCLFGCFKK